MRKNPQTRRGFSQAGREGQNIYRLAYLKAGNGLTILCVFSLRLSVSSVRIYLTLETLRKNAKRL
ncbi:MAG: hypothetical protein AUG51_26195 [Acidobacteria bacterium 13_1_20CM_3_53_8]|nr:MAG: hypothetical protein AUG51_26195 [Acidobacteria bacterium 13_1_20CM_3_53_8]